MQSPPILDEFLRPEGQPTTLGAAVTDSHGEGLPLSVTLRGNERAEGGLRFSTGNHSSLDPFPMALLPTSWFTYSCSKQIPSHWQWARQPGHGWRAAQSGMGSVNKHPNFPVLPAGQFWDVLLTIHQREWVHIAHRSELFVNVLFIGFYPFPASLPSHCVC